MSEDYGPLLAAAAKAQGIEVDAVRVPEDQQVEIGGLDFHYLDWGSPRSGVPSVVLLHGGRLTAHTWDLAALLLRERYHLVALDQRGHGDSARTPEAELGRDSADLMLGDTRGFIEHVCTALHVDRVALVGMSMGGMNAIRYAARHPERLSALCIVDVAPETLREGQVEMADFERATETLDRFEDFLERAMRLMPHRPEAHLRYSLHHSLRQTSAGAYTWKYDARPRPAGSAPNPETRRAGLWADVRAIATPTLLMRGAESKILSEEIALRTVKEMQDARGVLISRATHNVHSDNPTDFAAALDDFLSPPQGLALP